MAGNSGQQGSQMDEQVLQQLRQARQDLLADIQLFQLLQQPEFFPNRDLNRRRAIEAAQASMSESLARYMSAAKAARLTHYEAE
ncbi:hypothetical protein [Archangium sp.]|uniref:hypothetical protein n=1 Tax=Archangium sp. TaxID=1872627 RepID=UPI00389A3116